MAVTSTKCEWSLAWFLKNSYGETILTPINPLLFGGDTWHVLHGRHGDTSFLAVTDAGDPKVISNSDGPMKLKHLLACANFELSLVKDGTVVESVYKGQTPNHPEEERETNSWKFAPARLIPDYSKSDSAPAPKPAPAPPPAPTAQWPFPLGEKSKKKKAVPHVTQQSIDDVVVKEIYPELKSDKDNASLKGITTCVLVLANGFKVIGVNMGPVDSSNFSEKLAKELAYKDAVRQVTTLLAYDLKKMAS